MGDGEIAARIQHSVDRLTGKDRRSEKRLEVRGARAVLNKKVYYNQTPPVHISKLDLKPSPKVKDHVKTILNEWAAGTNLTSLMSEDLLLHLNLPVRVWPRNCWLFQALVLGENLPFILLTLYDGDSVDASPDRQEMADFAMSCARVLTFQLLSYCKKDFILLPCTLEYGSFDVQGLREEVKGQKYRAAEFYQGPFLLREESYQQICTALSILATASDVPYFFEESPDAERKVLVGDSEGDDVLRQIISYLLTNGAANSQPLTIVYTEMTRAVKMILLEAAKRLSYFQRTIIITDCAEVQKCVEKLAKYTEKEFGLDPSRLRSISLQEAKLSKHITMKNRTALSKDADMTDKKTKSSKLSDRHHDEPATHQMNEKATVTVFEGAGFTTAKTEENIPEKLAPNKETYAMSISPEAVKSNDSLPNSTAPLTDATAATETQAQDEKDAVRRKRKDSTEKPWDLIECSSNDMASDEPTYTADGTASDETSADDPTPKKRKTHNSTSSDTGLREGNSDVMTKLETSTKGGKAVGMDDYWLFTHIIAIDTQECPEDCHLRLKSSESNRPRRHRVLLVGKSGSGKSSTANTLLGQGAGPFRSAVSFGPVTRSSQAHERRYEDVILEVVETPGVFAMSGSFASWSSDIHGPRNFDALCFVIRIGRFTEEDAKVLERLQQVYKTDLASHAMVIFTGRDSLGKEDFESMLDQAPSRLKSLLEKCGGRHCVFDNTRPGNQHQVAQFMKFVRALKNSEGFRCPSPAELESRWERERLEDLERKRRNLKGG